MPAPHIDHDHASPPHRGSTSFDSRLARIRAKTDTGLTLISISGEIDASNVDDALIASHAVNQLLQVGDHDTRFPAVGSATEALLLVRRSSRSCRSLQLVSPAG